MPHQYAISLPTLEKFIQSDSWVEINTISSIFLSGDDSRTFLQGQLTCDMTMITPERCSFAAYCNNKGRVVVVLLVVELEQGFLLLLPKERQQEVFEKLSKIAVFSKVELSTTSKFNHMIGLTGPNVEHLLSSACNLPNSEHQVVRDKKSLIFKISGVQPRYLILTNDHSWLKPISEQINHTDNNVWLAHDVLVGLPHVQESSTAQFTPQMLNLKNHDAVSFTKGCYIGQEVIARTEHLGKVKRSLYRAVFSTDSGVQTGEKLFDNQQNNIGEIINQVKLDKEITLALAVIKISAIENQPVVYLNNKQTSLIVEPA